MSGGKRIATIVILGAVEAMLPGPTRAVEATNIRWNDVTVEDAKALPFGSVDESVTEHPHEHRGFVTVPLDYEHRSESQIEIFYRLLPATGSAAGTGDAPILVVMNGGPGVPSSAYRSLSYDYDTAPSDAFSELSRYFRILAVDQRGTGNSAPLDLDDPGLSPPVIAKLFDSDEHARDHARVIEAVVPEGEPFFILARSYGGEIGFQYLTLDPPARAPRGFVFDSAILPHTDALETFLLRRRKQRDLNLELRAAVPGIVEQLGQLRSHLEGLGLGPANVNFLWSRLGKGPGWERDLERRVEALTAISDRSEMEAELGSDIRGSVNLLNYVLSSASLTPGYTDRTMTQEIRRRVPFESWMLDESWTLTQIGNDGTWREAFIRAVDRNPPPPVRLPSAKAIRRALGQHQVLFTFGKSDAFLPQDLQLERARRFHVPGHTEFRVFAAGHGAAFSAAGAKSVSEWTARLLRTMAPDADS